MKKYLSIFLLSNFIFIISCCGSSLFGEQIKYTGTFSSLEYNEEGGDLLGAEIRIVLAQEGYQAMIQIAEGEPSNIILTPVNLNENIITFLIVKPELYAGKFSGFIDSFGIKGVLKFNGSGQMELKLPRKKSYWD